MKRGAFAKRRRRGAAHLAVSYVSLAIVACSSGAAPRERLSTAPASTGAIDATARPPPTGAPAVTSADRTRVDFVNKLARVRPGMSTDEVTKLLGPPDDVRTERDPGGIAAARTAEVWRYGTDGHLSFATLGTIHVEADHKVQWVFGNEGAPPSPTMFTEDELRRLLRLIDAVPSYMAPNDPLALIRAVNALQPLGKERALAAIAEYLRVASSLDDGGREGTFLLLRTLFDVPADAGHFPAMMVGAPTVAPPADPNALPRFPIVIVDDVPFSIVRGYSLGGQAEPPEHHLEWFEEHAALRKAPLQPTSTPLATLDRMIGKPKTPFLSQTGLRDDDRRFILDQGVLLLRTVIADAPDARANADDAWRAIEAAHGREAFRWNGTAERYERSDGTALAEPAAPIYARAIWKLSPRGAAVSIILERKTDDRVDLEVRIDLTAGASFPASKLRLLLEDGAELAAIDLPAMTAPPSSTTGSVSGRELRVKKGTSIRGELAMGKSAIEKSDALEP